MFVDVEVAQVGEDASASLRSEAGEDVRVLLTRFVGHSLPFGETVALREVGRQEVGVNCVDHQVEGDQSSGLFVQVSHVGVDRCNAAATQRHWSVVDCDHRQVSDLGFGPTDHERLIASRVRQLRRQHLNTCSGGKRQT